MKISKNMTFRSAIATIALGLLPLGFGQISNDTLDSIFSRLNGEDYDARYAARIELHDEVSKATAPGNEPQQVLVESQLLAKLSSEPLLTTKLWILRQLEAIGSAGAVPALEALRESDDPKLADGAQMTLSRIELKQAQAGDGQAGMSKQELAELARNGANRSERSAAFSEIAKKDGTLAFAILNEADASAADFLRIAMTSKNKSLQQKTLALMPKSGVEKQIVILGALPNSPSTRVEKAVLALLGSEEETLELQALEAIGRVGSLASLDALLSRISARDRDIREAASEALSLIRDTRIDSKLKKSAAKGSVEERILAVEALSLRATPEVTQIVNRFAADDTLDSRLREVAISSMEEVGDVESFSVLVNIVVNDKDAGLAKDAQKTLKRMSLRLADPDAAWAAFKTGFATAGSDMDKRLALMLVSDSAASKGAIEYLKSSWDEGDDRIQKMILRVLPSWRNWDGGFALLELAEKAGENEGLRTQCFKGIGNLILGSDATFPIEVKFELADLALKAAKNQDERKSVIDGFRKSKWKERGYVTSNEVDPELRESVLEFAKN